MAIPYVTEIDPRHGEVVSLSPLVRRVVAANPGRFTYTGTGTFIVGHGQVAVIDPGPVDDAHLSALLAAVAGEEVTHILATHTHRDHSPGAAALQRVTGAVTVGFGRHPRSDPAAIAAATPTTWEVLAPTAEELAELRSQAKGHGDHDDQEEPGDTGFAPDIEVEHGEVIAGGGFTLTALHTPGHIGNHLCFALSEEAAVFTGDHVMGWSTTIVPAPEGSMADYLDSLRLLMQREGDRILYPTHGPSIDRPAPFLEALMAHRLEREAQIIAALGDGPRTIPELVTAMYTATPHILHMAAGQSVLSHLVHLTEQGRVDAVDGAVTADGVFTVVR